MKSLSKILVSVVLAIAVTGCVSTAPKQNTSGVAVQKGEDSVVINGVTVINQGKNKRPLLKNLNLEPLQASTKKIAGHIVHLEYGPARVEGDASVLAAAGGGVAGGLLGNQVGKGNGRKVATVIGALAGAGAGAVVSSNMNSVDVNVYQIVVDLENGQRIQVIQADRGEKFMKGFRVYSHKNPAGYWEVGY